MPSRNEEGHMQTDTGTIRTLDETRSRRVPRRVLAAVAATAVVAAVAIAVPATLDETPAVRPVTVDTSLPAIGFSHVPPRGIGLSHVPPNGPLGSGHAHGPRQVPKQGALGG
jgi:hypothetical protein